MKWFWMSPYDVLLHGLEPACGCTAFLQAQAIATDPSKDWAKRYRDAADAIERYLEKRQEAPLS